MISVTMLSAIMLSVTMLSVMALLTVFITSQRTALRYKLKMNCRISSKNQILSKIFCFNEFGANLGKNVVIAGFDDDLCLGAADFHYAEQCNAGECHNALS